MDLIEHLNNKKNIRLINPFSYSFKLLNNKKLPFINNNLNKDIYKSFHLNNALPQIKKNASSLNININKNFFNKKLYNSVDQIQKNKDKNNLNNIPHYSFLQVNNNIISIKKSVLFKNKKKTKFNFKNSIRNIPIGISSSDISPRNNKNYPNESLRKENNEKNEIKQKPKRANSLIRNENQKEFVKTVNIYFKNKFQNNENSEIDDNNKKEDISIPKTQSMFMTGMNFLMPNNHKNKNLKNSNSELNIENKENKESKDNKINYNYLNFKELLKRIEENKKKIIDNQNDIEDMLLTAKDTHMEIWKCNHGNK